MIQIVSTVLSFSTAHRQRRNALYNQHTMTNQEEYTAEKKYREKKTALNSGPEPHVVEYLLVSTM